VRAWVLVVAAWVWAAVALVPATDAGWSLGWKVLLVPPVLIIGVAWAWWPRQPGPRTGRWSRVAWLSVPAAALAVVAVDASNVGLLVRVWLCEDELRAFAEAARAGKEDVGASGPNDVPVGLFHVDRTYGYGSEVAMVTSRAMFRDYGVLYWPDPQRANFGDGGDCRHLFGPWYWFSDGM
jgi:hypothetical protein